MQVTRRNGRAKVSVEDEIAHLRGLDLNGLRSRWQSVLRRPAPGHLPRHLLLPALTYAFQQALRAFPRRIELSLMRKQ